MTFSSGRTRDGCTFLKQELEALPPETHVFRIATPYQRDLHYDFTTLVENFLDPAHVPFAHHGVLGSRCACPLSRISVVTRYFDTFCEQLHY